MILRDTSFPAASSCSVIPHKLGSSVLPLSISGICWKLNHFGSGDLTIGVRDVVWEPAVQICERPTVWVARRVFRRLDQRINDLLASTRFDEIKRKSTPDY